MLTKKLINFLLLAVFLFAVMVSSTLFAAEEDNARIYEEKVKQIEMLGQAKDLHALERLGQEIKREWRSTDINMYVRLTLKVAQEIGSRDFKFNKRFGLAQDFAIQALEYANVIPLEMECKLIIWVQGRFNADGNVLQGAQWASFRKKQLLLRLHAWQRIKATIDKNWDPNDTGVINVCPPAGSNIPAGGAPSGIKDPQLRAEYEAAIEVNSQKIARSNLQILARRLNKRWIPGAQRAIIRAYIEAPSEKAELEELEKYLLQYGVDEKARSTILDAVKKKEMPKRISAKPSATSRPSE